MKTLIQRFRTFARDESGAAAVEYGLLAGLIAVVIVTSVTSVGAKLVTIFTDIATKI